MPATRPSSQTNERQNSCSLCVHKAFPVQYVVRNPRASLVSYLLVQLVLWAQLSRFELHPTDNVFSLGSKAQQTANLIDSMFGPNEFPFSLHRATNMGMWLEVIVMPLNASLLTPPAIAEIHQLDKTLRSINVSITKTRVNSKSKGSTMAHVNGTFVEADEQSKFQLFDVCAKESTTACSIDGSFILENEFLRDVTDADLQQSRSDFYTYPRRGLPSYGPYMFGKRINLSKYGTIDDLNALRFRYNLRGDISKKPITPISLRSALWEEQAGEVIRNFKTNHIKVLYASSVQLKKAMIGQNKQGLPYLIAATVAYVLTLTAATTKLSTSGLKYGFCIIAVLVNFTTVLTTFGTLTLFHYRPTAPSILAIVAIIVLGTHQFAIMLVRFEDLKRRPHVANNKALSARAFKAIFRQYAYNTLILLVFTTVVGLTTTIRDIRSACIIVAIGSIVIALNCLFAYLPLCHYGYRVKSLQLDKQRDGYLHDSKSHNESYGYSPVPTEHKEPSIHIGLSETEVARKKRHMRISMYISLFTLITFAILLLVSLLLTRKYMSSCTDQPGLNQSQQCGLVHASLFRQSNLLLPSIRTRIALMLTEMRNQRSKHLSTATSLYTFFKTADSEFTVGAPIQIIYRDDGNQDVCPTLQAADLLMSNCKELLETDEKFGLAWHKVFRNPIKEQDLTKSMFAKDVVLLQKTVTTGNASAGQLQQPCAFVKHYRVYCSFRTMRITLASIRTMRALEMMAQNASISISPERTGRFSTFSLAYFLLELVADTNTSFVIAIFVYLCCSIGPCVFHEMINARRKACLTKLVNSPSLSNRRRSIPYYHLNLKWMWNLMVYALEAVDVFLLSYVYICSSGVQIDFINAGLVLIGFLLMPACLNCNMLIEVTEDNAVTTPIELDSLGSIPKPALSRSKADPANKRCFGLYYYDKGPFNMRGSGHTNYVIPNGHLVMLPLLVSTVPLIWFAFMLPFTESPLLRIFEHVCFYTCIRGIFASIFVYISLKRFLITK